MAGARLAADEADASAGPSSAAGTTPPPPAGAAGDSSQVASAGATRELSGMLSSEAKWTAVLSDIRAAADPGSGGGSAESITALRVMHNDDGHAVAVARALAGNGVIRAVEIGALGPAGAAALAEALATTPALASLTLPAIDSDAAASALAAGLAARPAPLATLAIGALGPRGVEALGAALAAAGPRLGLRRLELSGCGLDSAAAGALGCGLAAQVALEELVLKAPREEGAAAAAAAAAAGSSAPGQAEPESPLAALLGAPQLRCHPALSAVSLSGARLGPAAATALGALLAGAAEDGALAACHTPLPPDMRLALSDCGLGDDGAALLATAVATPTGARAAALDLERCGLGASAAAALGTVARASPRLRTLRLSGDEIGPVGAAALAAALAGHPALAELSLCSTGIEAGGDAIAALLSHPDCALTTLALPGNRLPDATAAAAAAALAANATLTRLDLSSNWIGDAGGTALAGPLASHPTLRALSLDGNRLRTAGVEALSDAALSNQRILELGAATTRVVSNLVRTCAADVQRALQQRRARAEAGGSGGTSGASTQPASRRASRSSDRGENAGGSSGPSGSTSPGKVVGNGTAVPPRVAFADEATESPRAGKLPRRDNGAAAEVTFFSLPIRSAAAQAQELHDLPPGGSPFGSPTQQAKPQEPQQQHVFGPMGGPMVPVTPPLFVCQLPGGTRHSAGDAAALAALVAGGLLPPTPAACLCCGAPPCGPCAAALRAGLSVQLLGPQPPEGWGRSRSISLEGWAPRGPASPLSGGGSTADSLDKSPSLSLWHDAHSDGMEWPMSPDAAAARASLDRTSLDGGGLSSPSGSHRGGLVVHTRGGALVAHRTSSGAGALPRSPSSEAAAAAAAKRQQVSSPQPAHHHPARPASRLGTGLGGGRSDVTATCSTPDFPLLPSAGTAALL